MKVKLLVVSVGLSAVVAACGSDDDPPATGPSAAGKAGAAGTGVAGNGGAAAGKGGAAGQPTAGAAGQATGGAAGASGGAGSPTTGGAAGTAGTAGAAGAAAGAAGGAGAAGASGGSAGQSGSAGAAGTAGSAGSAGASCGGLPDLPEELPETLAGTGLFAPDGVSFSPLVNAYVPRFVLWSDGVEKDRHVYLPPCTTIDTSDPDHWDFPVGTRFWKGFAVGGKTVETRFLIIRADGVVGYATYEHSADGKTTKRVKTGSPAVNGTTHDIPNEASCSTCHGVLPERVLGFGSIQLSHAGAGQTLTALAAAKRFSTPIPAFTVPGDDKTVAALGYLHANCGNCHNEKQFFPGNFDLRLRVGDKAATETQAYKTTVGVATANFMKPPFTKRVVPGKPEDSAVLYRMEVRGSGDQMPPIASKVVDAAGVKAVRSWIEALPN